MENPIAKILKEKNIIIIDGALATELERRGININDDLWSARILAENPEAIEQVHYDYYCAGADCGISASYQATIPGFMNKGYSEKEAEELICQSMELLLHARERFWKGTEHEKDRPYPLAAASIGPYGAYMADGSEYRGNYPVSYEELMDFHRKRMQLLVKAGADILACETLPSLEEAEAILEVMKDIPIYCWISFSCRNENEISDGTAIAECAAKLDKNSQVAAIGINCTAPEFLPKLIDNIRQKTSKPIIVYPNSGEEYHADTKEWSGCADGLSYGQMAKKWYERGARLIGGCCRTTPEDICEIAQWAKNL